MKHFHPIIIILFLSTLATASEKAESVCYGSTNTGRIENAWQLPDSGENFFVCSSVTSAFGRNYVHSKVYAVVLDAYADLKQNVKGKVFVYGETGWKDGGGFWPHKTHQNGLSVDFFVPVIDTSGKSTPLPTGALNKFGYGIEFDSKGKYKQYSIDFEAMAAHLIALKKAADRHGVEISRVIFDNELQKLLFQTIKGRDLKTLMIFSAKKPWVRHDEHYHVDFSVNCK